MSGILTRNGCGCVGFPCSWLSMSTQGLVFYQNKKFFFLTLLIFFDPIRLLACYAVFSLLLCCDVCFFYFVFFVSQTNFLTYHTSKRGDDIIPEQLSLYRSGDAHPIFKTQRCSSAITTVVKMRERERHFRFSCFAWGKKMEFWDTVNLFLQGKMYPVMLGIRFALFE